MDYAALFTIAKHPLGLVGIVLFLVFGVLSQKQNMPPWWPLASITAVAVALLGGLLIAYLAIRKKQAHCAPAAQIKTVLNNLEASA